MTTTKGTDMKKKITAKTHTYQYEGDIIEVLHITGATRNDSRDDGCELCGLKIRNGNHSYMIQRANGMCGVESNDGHVYLPAGILRDGNDPHQISLGFWQIGSECRKQLPEQFVTKRSNIVGA
jgi:hypothetical protein